MALLRHDCIRKKRHIFPSQANTSGIVRLLRDIHLPATVLSFLEKEHINIDQEPEIKINLDTYLDEWDQPKMIQPGRQRKQAPTLEPEENNKLAMN